MQKLIFQQNHFSLFIRDPGGFDSYTVTRKCSIRGCMCSEFLKLWSKDEWKHLQVAFVYTVNKRMSSLSVYVLLSVRTLTVLGVLVLVLLSKLCCRRRFMIVHIPTSTGNRNHPSKKTCSFMSFIPILDVKKLGGCTYTRANTWWHCHCSPAMPEASSAWISPRFQFYSKGLKKSELVN